MKHTTKQQQTFSDKTPSVSKMNWSGLVVLILTMAAIFFSASVCSAGTAVYVAQTTAGAASGADCADAKALSGVTWTAGNTYYICGTITSQVAPSASGTSSNLISIIFETGAQISMGTCGSSGCLNLGGLSYILVDGSPTSTPCGYVAGVDVACNGIIQATNEGTGLSSSDSYGIYARGASNLEIRNLEIKGMYVHSSTSDTNPSTSNYSIWIGDPGGYYNIHNMILHDAPAGVVSESPANNITVAYSQLYNLNWGVFISGAATVNGITTVSVHDNDLHDWENWDTTTDTFHHDGVMMASNDSQGETVNGIDVYNNYFHGPMSSPTCSGGNPCLTASIFMEGVYNFRIYNNLIVANTGEFSGNGWIFTWSPTSLLNNGDFIGNNTVIGSTVANGGCVSVEGDSSMSLENNILSGCAYFVWMYSNTTWTALNNNVYQGSSLQWRNVNTYYSTLASWQSAAGKDSGAVATTSSLDLSSTFVPQTGSPAIGMGANLTSLGFTALDSDKAGVARPATGAWDAGAYQSGSSTSAQAPMPPTGLTASVQ